MYFLSKIYLLCINNSLLALAQALLTLVIYSLLCFAVFAADPATRGGIPRPQVDCQRDLPPFRAGGSSHRVSLEEIKRNVTAQIVGLNNYNNNCGIYINFALRTKEGVGAAPDLPSPHTVADPHTPCVCVCVCSYS